MSISFDFSGKSVLVTGASSGIGFAVAQGFAKAGADLTILSSTDKIFDAIKNFPSNVKAIKCDISKAEIVTKSLRHIKKLDILVNNAGLERPTPLTGENQNGNSVFERIVAINIIGTQNVTDTLVNRISEGGRIILTSSIWAKMAVPGFSAYTASKHANVGLMRTWAKELGSRRICVNAVCPGWIKTTPAMLSLKNLAEKNNKTEQEIETEISAAQALSGLMKPDEITDLYLFLASSGGDNITGQAINIDRGEVMS